MPCNSAPAPPHLTPPTAPQESDFSVQPSSQDLLQQAINLKGGRGSQWETGSGGYRCL